MIRIGKYIITKLPDGSFWISVEADGEGGRFKEEDFLKAVAEFYKEYF